MFSVPVMLEQPLKARMPINLTEFDIFIDDNSGKPWQMYAGIFSTEFSK